MATSPQLPNTFLPTMIAAVPIGEFDTAQVRAEFDAILQAVQNMGADLAVAEPISDEAGARALAQTWAVRPPDLLLLIPLRGLSAQAMEAAALACPAPCLIWPVQGRFALPSSTLAAGALREAGAPVELLFAPPNEPAAIERLGQVARAATAYSRVRRSRIGIIGGLFPNLIACRYDPAAISARLGVTLLPLAYDDLRARMAGAAQRPAAVEQESQRLTQTYTVEPADRPALAAGVQLHLALKQLAHEQRLDAFAAECWTGLPRELGLNPCLGFADEAYTLACEGDVMLAVSLLMVRALTGRRAYVGDLYDLDLDGQMTLIHCGAPASLAAGASAVVLGRSRLALERGYETVTCRPRLAPGPATLFRFYGLAGDKLHIARAAVTASDQTPNLAVELTLAGSRWDFIEQCAGNHYIVAPGDLRAELGLLARWLQISIVET